MDQKQKKLYIFGGIGASVLLGTAGLAFAFLAPEEEPRRRTAYNNVAPTQADVEAQPGQISLVPEQVTLTRAPDGKVSAIVTVSALFKEFTPERISIVGDDRLSHSSDCLKVNEPLKAGERCNVTISFNENGAAPAAGPAGPIVPQITIIGKTLSAGGTPTPIDARATIVGTTPGSTLPAADAFGNPITTGAAPAGLDPYGAAPPMPGGPVGAPGYTPPPDYAAGPPAPPPLSPREQFILARRQAVLGQARPNSALPEQKPQGGWDELNIPTATSSMPQDMTRVVTMDRIITAVLVRPYDSRASQQVVAQVDRNVYGAHGRSILIPRGSQIIGIAQGGGERVAIDWKQIIRPDGARFMIEASTGDAMGQAGVPGRINQRLLKRYGSILLGTALNVGIAKGFKAEETPSGGGIVVGGGAPSAGATGGARNNGAIISDLVRKDIEAIVQDVVERNKEVAPIITVPAGSRLTVIPTMDIQLRPLQGRQERARSYPRAQNAGAPAPQFSVNVGQPQARQPDQAPSAAVSPLPAATVPQTGSTPPWGAN